MGERGKEKESLRKHKYYFHNNHSLSQAIYIRRYYESSISRIQSTRIYLTANLWLTQLQSIKSLPIVFHQCSNSKWIPLSENIEKMFLACQLLICETKDKTTKMEYLI